MTVKYDPRSKQCNPKLPFNEVTNINKITMKHYRHHLTVETIHTNDRAQISLNQMKNIYKLVFDLNN